MAGSQLIAQSTAAATSATSVTQALSLHRIASKKAHNPPCTLKTTTSSQTHLDRVVHGLARLHEDNDRARLADGGNELGDLQGRGARRDVAAASRAQCSRAAIAPAHARPCIPRAASRPPPWRARPCRQPARVRDARGDVTHACNAQQASRGAHSSQLHTLLGLRFATAIFTRAFCAMFSARFWPMTARP